jgi:hypothetical protein
MAGAVCSWGGAEGEKTAKGNSAPQAADVTYSCVPRRETSQRPQVPIERAARAGIARFGYHRAVHQLRWPAYCGDKPSCGGAVGLQPVQVPSRSPADRLAV